ncbi:putative transcription factor [Sesbania bispinosa]|nr:putative transcription factor [Sesbania bispinosa]
MDGHSLSGGTIEKDSFSTYLNVDKLNPSPGALASEVDNFSITIGSTNINERIDVGSQYSLFMNASTSIIKPDVLVSASENRSTINSKLAMSPFSIGTCIEDDLGTTGGHSLYGDTTRNDLLSTFFNMDKLNPSSGAPASTADNFVVASEKQCLLLLLVLASTMILAPWIVTHSPVAPLMNTFPPPTSIWINKPILWCPCICCRYLFYAIGTTNINERLDVGSRDSQFMNGSTSIIKPNMLVSAFENGSTINSKQTTSSFSISTWIDDDLGTMDGHSLYDDTTNKDVLSTYLNIDKLNPSSGVPASTADNFAISSGTTNINERLDVGSQHSQFMNGSTSIIKPDMLVSASENGSTINSRKAKSATELAELALVDPKRAKRYIIHDLG